MSEQYCLICHKDMRNEGSLKEIFYTEDVICESCRSRLHYFPKTIKLKQFNVHGLYEYDNLIRDMILQYKEYNDEALYPLFLYPYIKRIRSKYKDYILVPAPSFQTQNEKRGFKHVNLIFSILNLPILDVLEKTSNIEQKKQSIGYRNEVAEYIKLKDDAELSNKKVLVVDDIITSGETLKGIYRILNGKCRCLSFMVVCYNKRYLSKTERRIKTIIENEKFKKCR